MKFHFFHKLDMPVQTRKVEAEMEAFLKPSSLIAEHAITEDDCIVALGGDGTFMNAAKLAWKHNCYITGFNCGNLGLFLEEKNSWPSFFENLETFPLQYYHLLDIKFNEISFQAFNEVMLASEKTYEDIQYKIVINDKHWCEQKDIGVVCSTSQGSTAHARQLGGSIILNAPVMQLTSLVAGNLHPLVMGENQTITLSTTDSKARLVIDGQLLREYDNAQEIHISLNSRKIKHIVSTENFLPQAIHRKIISRI